MSQPHTLPDPHCAGANSWLPCSTLHAEFRSPPVAFGPVPFYWWVGEKLDRKRLTWQLDQLCAHGVRQTIISYSHRPDNTTDPGAPPVFSPEWWDLFRWFLAECRQRDMTVGIQDYTMVHPILQDIGRHTPDMQGGQLDCVAQTVTGPTEVRLAAASGAVIVGAWAYADATLENSRDLTPHVRDGVLVWTAPAGNWLVALVFAYPNPFDPLHPQAGQLALERLYAPFERECPGEVGRTLNLFFQDELDFGSHMPFWSNRLFEVLGEPFRAWLPALWHDLGPRTTAIRLEFADAVVRRLEDCYFKPVFAWHEAHGTLFGNDNCGRGDIGTGRQYYGDYFRTMRWYTAPGNDDPKIAGARSFKGLKVNSSIAHLYRRPRVWNEAFHSSGWGTTPADVIAAFNEDFAYGATVVNLHGLFYTTRGGWWEWAPPDFHFRQPYWQHSDTLNSYFTRLAWLLSQGAHRCDVAMLYPITALDAEPAVTGAHQLVAHVDSLAPNGPDGGHPQPEATAFGLGKFLFDRACDFDFIDFESLERAATKDGQLQVSDESYRVLILPATRTVRYSTLEKARDFVRAGGVVIAFGCLPELSERDGAAELVHEIFGSGRGLFVRQGYDEVVRLINELVPRDVAASAPLQVLHRKLDAVDVFYLFNPALAPVTTDMQFRVTGNAEQWDAWTGNAQAVPVAAAANGVTTLCLALAAREAKVIVFHSGEPRQVNRDGSLVEELRLADTWDFTVHPTLDNRFGDFRLPATAEKLGPEARRFRYAEETVAGVPWHEAAFDDSAWPETTYSFGPRFEVLGPDGEWRPYSFSLRWGIERDPFLTDWLSGPHGLKGQVPDEFLDFYSETPGTEWHLRAQVVAKAACNVLMRMGGRCAYQAWVNDAPVLEQPEALPPGKYPPWNIPHYECTPRETRVRLRKGVNHLRLKLVQPTGQRTRAFVAFAPPPREPGYLGLRWFRDPQALRPSCPGTHRAVWLRCSAPPGMRELEFAARGPVRVWANGRELTVTGNRAVAAEPFPAPVTVALRVEAPAEFRAGDVLLEPVRFLCGAGRIKTGDWCAHGLAAYSGIGEYRQSVEFSGGGRVWLALGDVAATAEVLVNGKSAGVVIAPPWRVEATGLLRAGRNDIVIRVANTLANHYSVGIPTPYAFPSQTRSGLIGPVRIIREDS